MPVRDAGDHGAQPDPVGLRGQEGQDRASLKQRRLRRLARDRDLEEAIHGPQAVEACFVGALGGT